MQLAQMDAWMKVLISYIPQIIMLIAAIMVMRRYRSWLTIILVTVAALNILLPVAAIMTKNAVNQRALAMQPQMQGMKTQQEVQQLLQNDPTIQNYNTLLTWLAQGIYLSAIAFAVALLMAIRLLLSKAAPAIPCQSSPPPATESGSKTPDQTC